MRTLSIYLVLIFCSGPATAQLFQPVNYPKTIFRNPLAIPMSLAANFGELRRNHYHMGLDIRTRHQVNLPVYAAADGYISSIKIEPFGFGQAVYIRHPQGYITLYAHLNAFNPGLASYVKKKQYEIEKWDVFLDLPAGLFPVKKGDLIAYSGNMGGSQGPHLHFEIRELPDDVNLNPLLFGLPVLDNTPPVVRKLAVYDRNKSIYEQSPAFYPVKGAGSEYTLGGNLLEVHATRVGFGISGFDTQTGSANPNGIYQAVVYDNGQPISGFRMNHISYNDTRGINAHIDYRTKA
ncbi:MAG: M23 family metallopeptidase, partial [Puia sp.]